MNDKKITHGGERETMQVIHLRGDTKNATLYVYFYQAETGEVERDKECLELNKNMLRRLF